eukprot:TRINITY_DN35049_c0_g1_i1.p1 TRINITY_DN35049_c0_g1~~TRINITY_DN35049_c0_g1_i1.p1  ORF type:complete len:608 (+),score=83.20 TRINITY_DN35049_c0_g1_i1:51-1826(+)
MATCHDGPLPLVPGERVLAVALGGWWSATVVQHDVSSGRVRIRCGEDNENAELDVPEWFALPEAQCYGLLPSSRSRPIFESRERVKALGDNGGWWDAVVAEQLVTGAVRIWWHDVPRSGFQGYYDTVDPWRVVRMPSEEDGWWTYRGAMKLFRQRRRVVFRRGEVVVVKGRGYWSRARVLQHYDQGVVPCELENQDSAACGNCVQTGYVSASAPIEGSVAHRTALDEGLNAGGCFCEDNGCGSTSSGSGVSVVRASGLVRLQWQNHDRDSKEQQETVDASVLHRLLDCDKIPVCLVEASNFESFCVRPWQTGWSMTALRLFRRNGFVVVKGALDANCCHKLLDGCREAEKQIFLATGLHGLSGNRGPGRWSFAVASKTGSMLHHEAWVSMLECKPLLELIQFLFPAGGFCVAAGGDYVEGDTGFYQHLHSDVSVHGPFDVDFPPPYVSANFAVQHIDSVNGPTRIVPGTQCLSVAAARELAMLPNIEEEPREWRTSVLQPLEPGDLFLRDVRVLHGGTPNGSSETRFLPSVEFASADFRGSKHYGWQRWECPAISHELADRLSFAARRLVPDELVCPEEQLNVGWWDRGRR